MTIWIVDIETKGLNAREFLCASLIKESGKKKIFYDKDELWRYILEGGRKEFKRKRVLNIYSHNAQYDFYGYADLNDSHIRFFSFNPLIASYRENGKDIIKFLDSYGIFKFSLKTLGEIIGLEKLELPEEFTNPELWERVTKKRLKEISPYVLRDSEIVMKAMKIMKEKLQKEGIYIRRIYTISQVAINYLMNFLRQNEEYHYLFEDEELTRLCQTKLRKHIHSAYRGGRVECWKTGHIEKISYIDCNNLYGYASMNIRFPDLRTERFVYKPLEYFSQEYLLKQIGISRVILYNKSNKIGLIPITTLTGSYYPKEDKYIVGTYTNLEIEEALKEGYELIDVEFSLLWDEGANPFKELTPKLYKLRIEDGDLFNKFFYKEMQNRSYGKLAQSKEEREYVIDNVEEAQKYLEENWKILSGQKEGYNYLYEREGEFERKNYYAPIIPTLINAWARVFMYHQFKRIPYEDLVYHDTDSIIFTGEHLDKFEISGDIGKFKVEHTNKGIIIYGRKTYAIEGEENWEIKIAGFRKKDISIEDFKRGNVKSKKMLSLKGGGDIVKAGTFVDEVRDLNEQLENFRKTEELMAKEKIYKDIHLLNINYFAQKIGEIMSKYT